MSSKRLRPFSVHFWANKNGQANTYKVIKYSADKL